MRLMFKLFEADKEAIIYLNEDELYGDTIKQIRDMITDPSVHNARIMPDCHYGTGCCVGFTSKLTEYTVPRYIGGDIGCGMTTYKLDETISKKIHKNMERYHDAITAIIPLGNNKRVIPVVSNLNEVARRSHSIATVFHNKMCGTVPPPEYDEAWIRDLYQRIGIDESKVMSQLGTLGGGNHFIEIGVSSEQTEWQGTYISIHTGSRALGQAVCQYHQDIITRGSQKDHDGYLRELLCRTRVDKSYRNQKRRQELEIELKAKYLAPKHPKYLKGKEAEQYFYDMIFAQQYARYNRFVILDQILLAWGADIPIQDRIIESIHNYIDFEDHVWRKGAIKADLNQIIIIALNMRDGILLARGKGNQDWNCSAPHGTGRKVPRSRAHQHTNLKQFQAQMTNVFTKSICKNTIDESPDMYKNPELVQLRASETCEIIAHLRPLINIKATD